MKKPDPIHIKIGNIIVHDIPKHRKGDASISPTYSSSIQKLDNELTTFFKKKIVDSLSGYESMKVVFNPNTDSCIPEIISRLLGSDVDTFVHESQYAAKELFDRQTAQASSGVFVAIQASFQNQDLLIVLKLERDEGARLAKSEETGSFILESVKDLMLTQKTRLLKSALFFNYEHFGTDFTGYAVDSQRIFSSSSGIATFFLDYLGCKLYHDSRKQTKEMFELSFDYISKIGDPEIRIQQLDGLISYFKNNNTQISPEQFAIEYVTHELQDDYIWQMQSKGIDTKTIIQKDTELISNRLKRIKIVFDNGLVLYALEGDLSGKATVENIPGNAVRAEIQAKIINIST